MLGFIIEIEIVDVFLIIFMILSLSVKLRGFLRLEHRDQGLSFRVINILAIVVVIQLSFNLRSNAVNRFYFVYLLEFFFAVIAAAVRVLQLNLREFVFFFEFSLDGLANRQETGGYFV